MTKNKAKETWKKRLKPYFNTTIRRRGEAYAKDKRVILNTCTHNELIADVQGTSKYTIHIKDKGKTGFAISCSCPYFRQGFACKHLWASIVAADRFLASAKNPKNSDNKLKWEEILLPQNDTSTPPPYLGSPQDFMLRYELKVVENYFSLRPYLQYVTKSGKLGKQTRNMRYEEVLADPHLLEEDRVILNILSASMQRAGFKSRHYLAVDRDEVMINLPDLGTVLPYLALTKRCSVSFSNDYIDPLLSGNPKNAQVLYDASDQNKAKFKRNFEFKTKVYIPETQQTIPLGEIKLILPSTPVLFIYQSKLYFLPDLDANQLQQLLKQDKPGNFNIPKKQTKSLYASAHSKGHAEKIQLPENFQPKEKTKVTPVPVMAVQIEDSQICGTPWFKYSDLEVSPEDNRPAILDLEKWERINRDFEQENQFLKELHELGFDYNDNNYLLPRKKAGQALNQLGKNNWELVGRDKKKLRGGVLSKTRVSSGIDWFELEGDIDFGDMVVPLPRAVKAYLKGENFVPLDDGSIGLLSEEWLEKNKKLLDLAASRSNRPNEDRLAFHSSQALLLDALLAEQEDTQVDDNFLKVKKGLEQFEGIERLSPPKGFQGELRHYQEEGLGWFQFLKDFGFNGILADDMGLGKTIQVLAWLLKEEEKGVQDPWLVVAPVSLLGNWFKEAQKFAPTLKIMYYFGQDREAQAQQIPEYNLILTSYGVLRRDIPIIREYLFHYAILDESQAIKNSTSLIAKTVRLLQARHKLCLTGTPLENHVGELWSQMEFLNPKMLGTHKSFERRFIKPIAQGDEKSSELLQSIVRPFILRRTKDEVIRDLPDKIEELVHCPLEEWHQKFYNQIRDHYKYEVLSQVDERGLERSKIKILEGLLRMRQAACHPAMVGGSEKSTGKLTELLNMLQEVTSAEHKVLVFSQFTKFLRLIRRELDQQGLVYEYLDGQTPRSSRDKSVHRFQNSSEVKLFLISLKAGGFGLNLTAADYVFIMDPWWNPAVEMQAVDRTHRIGQDKKVFTYRLISQGTVEEKVMELQKKKKEMVDNIMSGSKGMLKHLSRQDLEAIFA